MMGNDETRICRHCQRELPASEFYASKRYICKACFNAQGKAWREANIERVKAMKNKYNHKIRGKPVRARSLKEMPLSSERNPIPALEVGKAYEITERLRNGMDDESFVGPCIARYGVNWAVRTATGIRCFTPATLVGLVVREISNVA